ncbi:MAG: hypothetical protein H0T21_01260 [Gemmatimonadaceae bacterium]|nr:hypothetical protein [Gemmatimonadaceae bacterium]
MQVRSGAWRRRAMLSVSAVPLFLLAMWVRTPAMQEGPVSGDGENAAATERATDALRSAIAETVERLEEKAENALDAPTGAPEAFAFLARRAAQRPEESVVLYDHDCPLAWVGRVTADTEAIGAPLSILRSPFYTTINVVKNRGTRRSVASAVLQAMPPADKLTQTIEGRIAASEGVASYEYAPGDSAAGGAVVLVQNRTALLRARPILSAPGEISFRRSATRRARGTGVLLLGVLLFLIYAWKDHRALFERLLGIAVALAITALIPWNTFSNTSRFFDPAFYFSRLAGPLTANAAALGLGSALVLLAVYAIIRARPTSRMTRIFAAVGVVLTLGVGIPLASNIMRGIGQPPWGSTPGLWLSWEIPLFLFLFAVLLLAVWLGRIALHRSATVSFRTAAITAAIASSIAIGGLWITTSRQRMQLAEQDVAGLSRVDGYALFLTRRFAAELARGPAPATRGDLLQHYAVSELAAAELPVTLATWDSAGRERIQFAVSPAAPDSAIVIHAVQEALTTGRTVTRSVLGPTGVQTLAVVPHAAGGATSALVLPRTRLLRPNAFDALLGMSRPRGGDPPYEVALTDVSPAIPADTAQMRWHRIGNEWHGDRLIATSAGTKRAHVELDLRSLWARSERGILVLLLNLSLAGLIWLLGAAPEGAFLRWMRSRASRWIYTYRARLTLALFTFFVIPAVAFAMWSYQRLRSDDLQTREVVVRETLHTVLSGSEFNDLATSGKRFDVPLFLYANGFLERASDPLFEELVPTGRALPPAAQLRLASAGELTAAAQHSLGASQVLFGYRAGLGPAEERYVLGAPARSDDLVLDRRRRDLGMLVLFATAFGALAALWLSGVAAKRLARDLELSRIEVARAERVLAWGEMARQVAHEIKNPLTPIRLGVQHLRRARTDPRVNFDDVLRENVGRILSEIDRLDEIARSFSRYGSAPADLPPAERVDVAAIVRDVMELERMGDRIVKWHVRSPDRPVMAMARRDEMRDVLLNIFENARLAEARQVDVAVREDERRVTIETIDNGIGIAKEVLPRIFEPHFSTRTTGSGLGLAVTRRVIEAWGGEISITSEPGTGTRVLIALAKSGP